ncbi:MAG: leucine-rich repeat protein, partial [Prevotella sp.]|nr:leucine-rich repeat protein [Prevotella sp.]
ISLSIPSSLTSIGNYVFSGCSNLISLSIPSSVTSIGNNAFRDCSGLTSVTIPSSVKYIYDSAFEGCNNISKLIVGNGIKSIASRAFALCSNIEHVYCYAEAVPSTSTNAFEDSYVNYATLHVPISAIDAYKSVTPWSTFKTIKSYFPFVDSNVEALCVNNWDTNGDSELSEVEAAAVTDLGDVFRGNTTITSFNELQYFTSLTSIANNAFNGCTGLASVVIPSNVEVIGSNAFTSTSITKIVIPDNVTEIGDGAFNGCSGLGSVTLSPSLIIIGTNAFSCTPISRMVIPGNVTEIGNGAFANCTNLAVLTVGNSVTKIGADAFAGCSLLKTVTIPSNVTSIGDNAFGLGTDTTTDLTSVIVKWTEPLAITENVFPNRANATLYVPADCKAKYETANYWKDFKTIVENSEVTSPFLVNAGFDEDLTWLSDGSMKNIVSTTTSLSDRSWAYIAEDNSVYAKPKSTSGQSRPDGRKLEATNGFIGQVQGWTLETNQTFPKCEWVYFGTIPYDLQDQAIPIADDGSTYLQVPARPAVASGDNNVGFAYYRAGWGGRAVFKQTVNLPKAKYRLEYWAININPTASNGTNLSKVTCGSDVWADETGFNDQEWTLHTILFEADGETSIELGFESSGGSGSNPFLCIDCVELFSIGNPDINGVVQFVDEGGNCIEDGSTINITEGIEDVFGDIQFPTGLYVENLSDEDIYVGLSFNVISLPNGSFQIAFPVNCINYSRVGSGKTSEGLLAAGEKRSLQAEWIPDVIGYGTCTVDLQINTYTYNSITKKYILDKEGPIVTVNMIYSDGDIPQPSTNSLSATSPTILTGNSSTLSFGMTNEDEIIMTEFYMQLPEGISIEEDEDGYPIVTISSERENKHVIEVNRNSEGLYHFLCYSSKNNAFKGNEGELFNMNLVCAEGVAAGTYTATVRNIIMSDVDRNELTQSDFTFDITVMDVVMGDANGDGRINGMDIVEMVDYIMERPSNSFVFAAADLTSDGKVNGMDLVELVSLVMAQGGQAPSSALPRREGTLQTEKLDEGALTLKRNENGGLMLGVENPDEFILAQMVVEISDGSLTDVTTDNAHVVAWSPIGENRYAVLAYSTRNRSFTTNDCLLTFLGCEGNITVKDVMFVDADREARFLADVTYNGTTGIESTPDPSLKGRESIYDLSGRKLETRNMELGTSPKGVYIVNGKKVVVK